VSPMRGRPQLDVEIADSHPTIAVIPFTAHRSDAQHQVLGEVLADALISALSKSPDVNVISRLSTRVFTGRQATVTEMSTHLNANYILSGNYRVSGSQVKLFAELADAKSSRVVWAHDGKAKLSGIVDGEAPVIDYIVAHVTAVVRRRAAHGKIETLPTLDSYSRLMKAVSLMHGVSSTDLERARALLLELVEHTPQRAVPYAWLGKCHVMRVWHGWSKDPTEDAQLARDAVDRALAADIRCGLALVIDGVVRGHLQKDLDRAAKSFNKAIKLNHSESLGWLFKGTLHAFKGEGKEALYASGRALRLSPLDPLRYYFDSLAATAALSARQYERAIELARRSLRAHRTHLSTLRVVAIAQWQLDRKPEARNTVAEIMK